MPGAVRAGAAGGDTGAPASESASVPADPTSTIDPLRRAAAGHQALVMGRGAVADGLEARLRRVERHLNLPPVAE